MLSRDGGRFSVGAFQLFLNVVQRGGAVGAVEAFSEFFQRGADHVIVVQAGVLRIASEFEPDVVHEA